MWKRITYLFCILMMVASTCLAAKSPVVDNGIWHPLDFNGQFADGDYSFNTETIRYGIKDDGTIDPNIIVYQEKKINNNSVSVQYKFYSIIQTEINIAEKAIKFGDETFYTAKGKLRWTDTPQYDVWLNVKPKTYGELRFQQIVDYAQSHHDLLMAHSKMMEK